MTEVTPAARSSPQTIGDDQGFRYEVWNEKPRMRVVTDVTSMRVPSQSRERRPEMRVGWVGGIGEGGRKRETMSMQKMMMGIWDQQVQRRVLMDRKSEVDQVDSLRIDSLEPRKTTASHIDRSTTRKKVRRSWSQHRR
jgi:hypothetical protein